MIWTIWRRCWSRPKIRASTFTRMARCFPRMAIPALNKYPHLVGNYGGAWQDQRKEFDAFPGAILMTTNCIQKPNEDYQARIFTSGLVAWPEVAHIADQDFPPVIDAALAARRVRGRWRRSRPSLVGFGHHAVLGAADKVIEAVKSGAIRHFFLIGGCDGAKPGRNYYTEFAEAVPRRLRHPHSGLRQIPVQQAGLRRHRRLPRLLDIGQCNDAYSAIKIAVALAEAFDCGVNDLPLSLILSWYEQKAVCILLTLLHLGIKNIRLGPACRPSSRPPS